MTATMPERWSSQSGFDLRFDWGVGGLRAVRDGLAAIVVVDVLRFTTAVEAAVSAGAVVYPYRWQDRSAAVGFARSLDAILAGAKADSGPSLSPRTLAALPPGSRVVLPSPNGATCTLEAASYGVPVFAACLRNATSVASVVVQANGPVAVIACGERRADGSLRPAVEDLIGAGAVLAHLPGGHSPEARSAVAAWQEARGRIAGSLVESVSGRELATKGQADDVAWAAELDSSHTIPMLVGGAYVASEVSAAHLPAGWRPAAETR